METGSAITKFIFVIMFCFIIYHSIPSKKKLDESFAGFINKSLLRFKYETSSLHTIVYGGSGTGKTYFVKENLKLNLDQDLDQDQDQDRRSIVIVCKDEGEWINPETGQLFTEINMCDKIMITSKNKPNFKDSVIVLDDMGNKLNKDISHFLGKEDIIIIKLL